MQLQRTDITQPMGAPRWSAVHLAARKARNAGFRVEVIPRWHLRLSVHSVGLVWARIADDFYGYDLLVSSRTDSPGVLPPITFACATTLAERARSGDLRRLWAHQFVDWLQESMATPLHDGDWLMEGAHGPGKLLVIDAETAVEILRQPADRYVDWDRRVSPILLRRVSEPDHGRVRAWRKLARRGSLPPVLLYWITGLAACVVLDGHDRLLAASLEGMDAPMLLLSRTRVSFPDASYVTAALSQAERLAAPGQPDHAIETANVLALSSFRPRYDDARTRAVPLNGGVARWRSEVRAHVNDPSSAILRH